MKKILSLTLAAALTVALFTGCGCAANVSTEPHGMITEAPTTRPSVMPTPTATHETTRPTEATLPTVTGSEPTGAGSAPTTEGTAPTESTMAPRHRPRDTAR